MERNYHTTDAIQIDNLELYAQTAFHEAGHAAAIYFGNRQKKLPPVYFEIQVSKPAENNAQLFAKVVDGQLIQNLPVTVIDNLADLSDADKHSYQCAYEADVMNLLVGPLAEAKYVAERDGEVFNQNLVNCNALKHYGGCSDVEKATAYLQYFIGSPSRQKKKMQELFMQAYRFINRPSYWQAVMQLAEFILAHDHDTISCEEIITVFNHYHR